MSSFDSQSVLDKEETVSSIDYRARYDLICRASIKDNDAETISKTLESSLNELTDYITLDLAALARRGCPDDFADILSALNLELDRFRQFCEFPDLAQRVIIGIGGRFSTGKSSFINTLLGKKRLVTEIDPTTSLPTYLLKGDSQNINAINIFNKKVIMSLEEFQSLTHDEKRIYGSQIGSLLTSAFISDPEFQWENLALLDTPGYTKPEESQHSERTDSSIARSQLNASQFILWLVSAEDGTIKEDDLQFLATLNTDIPKLVLVNKADKKTAEDITSIVSLIKKTLANRNINVLDVIPVSRKKRDYPTEPVTAWLDEWNRTTQEVQFGKNFKRQFFKYEQYIESQEHLSYRQLNHINRILTLTDSEDVTEEAEALLDIVKAQLQFLKLIKQDLKGIQNLFFAKLKAIGDQVGIEIPELNLLDELDLEGIDLYTLLCKVREEKAITYKSYESLLSQFMDKVEVKNLHYLLRRVSNKHEVFLNSLTLSISDEQQEQAVSALLRRHHIGRLVGVLKELTS